MSYDTHHEDQAYALGLQQTINTLRAQVVVLTQEQDASIAERAEGVLRNANLMNQLAASQAHVQQLRGGMLNVANGCRIWGGEAERARKMLEHYLALPSDDAALNAWGAKLLRTCWERLAHLSPDSLPSDWLDEVQKMADELEASEVMKGRT